MASREEKDGSLRSDPLGELESPFLSEEFFSGEKEEVGWQARLAALEAESPFLSALKAFEESQTPALVPETLEEETAEREAEGFEEYEDLQVPRNPTADAFVADKDGKEYFTTFPQLGNLTVKKATVLTPSNFESLMDHMLASNQKTFVIDAHGDPIGLHMPLASATKISATKHSLFILRGIEYIRSLVRIAKESETIWERASGADLERWRRIVEVLHSKTWQRMVGPSWPTVTPQVSNVDAAKSIVQSRISSLVDSLFPGGIANKQERVDRLTKKMLRLQAKGIREIQFRACNIGKDSNTLYEFRKFFGADHLCAPDVRSGIGFVTPSINRQAVDLLEKQRQTQVFSLSSGRFAIHINISGVTFTVKVAADSQGAVMEWVASHIMANSTYRKGKLPIHFLQTQPLVFALDKDYAAHIQCRSSFWEGAVRANELEEEEAHKGEESEPDRNMIGEEDTHLQREDEFEFDSQKGLDEIESEEESEAEELWEKPEEDELVPPPDQEEDEFLDSERDEEESVEAELEAPKRSAKKSSLHSVPTNDIFMHVYFKELDAGYTGQQFFDWIVGPIPDAMGPNRFQLENVEITLVNNSNTAVSDFKSTLKAAGSVVIYFGHTVLGPKTTLGLAPNDPPAKKPGIICAELTKLLNAAKAKIVVLAGCATSQCVTKIKGDTVVIVTQSGKNRVTNTLQWAPAIKALLDELLASGTVGDALAAANKSFAKASSTDSFKMINGDPTLKMI